MKKTLTTLVMVLALASLTASLAIAETESTKLPGDMDKCCVTAAENGKGCCGKSAEEVKAAYTVHMSAEAVKADMHPCCATALTEGKGCCGKTAKELNTSYTKNVETHYAAATTKGKSGCAAAAGCVKSCGAASAGCGTKAKTSCGTKAQTEAKADDKKANEKNEKL